MSSLGSGDAPKITPLPIRALKPAYEQVADQLRDLILSGELSAGDRLPTEAELCQQFGTSRSTIREALRLLASHSLITAKRGAKGGVSVSAPDPGDVTKFLDTALTLLAGTGELTASELFQARSLLEVPAAGMAAANASEAWIEQLRSYVPEDEAALDRHELFAMNQAFHQAIVLASGNRMLYLMTQPIFVILQRRFLGEHHGTSEFQHSVTHDHHALVDALASGDAKAAEAEMAAHLHNLAPWYRLDDHLGDDPAP